MLHGGPRLLALLVDGRRVPEFFQEIRLHSFQNFRKQRRRRIIVEINPVHNSIDIPIHIPRSNL
jgi:hypothetical protein